MVITPASSILRFASAVIASLSGVTFFFFIIGVFGMIASIAALLVYIASTIMIIRRRLE